MLANINCCVSSRAHGAAWPCGQLSTIRIRVPNRGSIRPNANSPFGPLFGPFRIRIFSTALERYGRYMSDLLHMPPKQKLNIKIHKDVENRVGMIKELVMVRDGLTSVYGDKFSCADVRVLIDFICSY